MKVTRFSPARCWGQVGKRNKTKAELLYTARVLNDPGFFFLPYAPLMQKQVHGIHLGSLFSDKSFYCIRFPGVPVCQRYQILFREYFIPIFFNADGGPMFGYSSIEYFLCSSLVSKFSFSIVVVDEQA